MVSENEIIKDALKKIFASKVLKASNQQQSIISLIL